MTREELIDALLEAPASSKADLRTYHGEAGKAVANNPKAYKKYKKGYKKRRRLNAVVTGATTVGGAAAGTLVGQPLAGAAIGAGMGYTRRKRRNRAAVATAHSWLKKKQGVSEAVNAKAEKPGKLRRAMHRGVQKVTRAAAEHPRKFNAGAAAFNTAAAGWNAHGARTATTGLERVAHGAIAGAHGTVAAAHAYMAVRPKSKPAKAMHKKNVADFKKQKAVAEAVNAKELKTRLKHPLKASRHGDVYDVMHGKSRVRVAPSPIGLHISWANRSWRGPGERPGTRIVTKSGRKYEQGRKKYVTKAIKREVKKRKAGKKLSHDQKWTYHRDLDKGNEAPR